MATIPLTGHAALGRAHLGLSLLAKDGETSADEIRVDANRSNSFLHEGLRVFGQFDDLPRGLLARAALRRSLGEWAAAARDLDEVEEIAEPGPMRLFVCDIALERARLALARHEAFAPLNGLVEKGPPNPSPPDAAKAAALAEEARMQLATARKLVQECGYHKRDEELAELEAVLKSERRFADLPPRV